MPPRKIRPVAPRTLADPHLVMKPDPPPNPPPATCQHGRAGSLSRRVSVFPPPRVPPLRHNPPVQVTPHQHVRVEILNQILMRRRQQEARPTAPAIVCLRLA